MTIGPKLKGLWLNEVFLKTFASHYNQIGGARRVDTFGNPKLLRPVGAAGLCAASVERAYKLWATKTISTDTLHHPLPSSLVQPTKDIRKEVGSNRKLLATQFCHATCGRYQIHFADSATKIKDAQWDVIIGAARRFAKIIRKPANSAVVILDDDVGGTSSMVNLRANLVESDTPRRFLDFSQHTAQHVSLELAGKIDLLLVEHPQLYLTIQHVKQTPALAGFKRIRKLALEAVKRPLANEERPPSIQYQRAETKAAAIQEWEQRYQESPRRSQAYDSALVTPPDGRVHMIFRIASTGLRKNGRHAFTGAYRIKFRHKNLPPATEEEVACACGAVPEDTEHVLLHCPLTHEQRLRHLSTDGLPDSLRKLFDSPGRCLGLLRFLEETRVHWDPRHPEEDQTMMAYVFKYSSGWEQGKGVQDRENERKPAEFLKIEHQQLAHLEIGWEWILDVYEDAGIVFGNLVKEHGTMTLHKYNGAMFRNRERNIF
ncbi:hypothetical protein V8E52_011460 [Russula decolorans]